jgi:hypothetical protein
VAHILLDKNIQRTYVRRRKYVASDSQRWHSCRVEYRDSSETTPGDNMLKRWCLSLSNELVLRTGVMTPPESRWKDPQ